jgi:hypothetical protein
MPGGPLLSVAAHAWNRSLLPRHPSGRARAGEAVNSHRLRIGLAVDRRRAVILHITTREAWDRARPEGSYRPESLATEGFIHCSTPEPAVGVANTFDKGQHGLVSLPIVPARLKSPLRFGE